jgi:hypothetical protein
MKLREALDQIDGLDEGEVIFAKKPWTLESEARIGRLDDSFRVPAPIAAEKFEYFIDVPVAKEVLSVFRHRRVDPQQRHELLLYYAEHDAYPDWAYGA